MFVFLSKILPPLLYPVGLTCLLLLLSLFLAKRARLRQAFLITALLLLLAGGNKFIADGLARSLEWRYLPPKTMPQADVIVVLGGATQSATYPRQIVEINSAGDRVIYAYALYQQGTAPHLLLSGGSIEWLSSNGNPASDMADLLILMGVPAEAMWQENNSRNTYENALECQKILQTKGIQRIILVTSALHMPRSVKLFEKQGLEVIPAPADFTVTQSGWQQITATTPGALLTYLVPSADNLSLTTKALKEYLGILAYTLRGWM